MEESPSALSYHCLAGHDIPVSRIEADTEIVVMDGGACVQICREHGCPVGIRRPAGPGVAEENG